MKVIQQPARAIMAVCAALVLTERAPVQAEANRPIAGRIVVWGEHADRFADSNDDLIAIAAGDYHGLAVRKDGTVVGWGDPWHVPPGLSGIVSVAGSRVTESGVLFPNHSLGLRRDGTVLTWGNVVSEVAGLTDVIAFAAGYDHRLALKRDGTVVAWGAGEPGHSGRFSYGQSTVPEGLTDVVAISTGWFHSLALRTEGTVVAWGAGGPGQSGHRHYGQSIVPEGLTDVVAIAAHRNHNLALREDGTIVAWGGQNLNGELNVPPDLHDVTAVAAGGSHCLALRKDGTVVAWGRNSSGQSIVPQGLRDVVAIAAGLSFSMALVAVHKPLLDMQRSDVHLRVAWPQSLTGYQLEMTDDFSNGSWIPVPDVPVIENSEHVVTRELSGNSRFFRLRQE